MHSLPIYRSYLRWAREIAGSRESWHTTQVIGARCDVVGNEPRSVLRKRDDPSDKQWTSAEILR
jgi:hypothetical protein